MDVLALLASALRLATPLILCAMGGLVSERAGIVDIGLEGKMLAGAFAAAATAAVTGSAWAGLAAACGAALALAAVHACASILHGGSQVVSGVAINMLASGLTIVLGEAWFRQGGPTPALQPGARFMPLAWPGVEDAANWPVVGPIFERLISGQSLPVYVALASVPLIAWTISRTRFGLRMRAAGEAPRALDAAGIGVRWVRWRAVLVCGILTGIAGAHLSIAQNAGFSREMTAGQGYIALAAVIFGKWRPLPVLGACLLFGLLDAAAVRLQGVPLPVIGAVPIQVFQVLPYGLTVILLAGFIGRADAPKALGVPFRPMG